MRFFGRGKKQAIGSKWGKTYSDLPNWQVEGNLTCIHTTRALKMITGNLFANVANKLADEQVVELLSAQHIRIERIVSTGHATALDEWYDQDRAEWVVLLAGSAALIFEGEPEPLVLEAGSYVHIGANVRHRVAWTDHAVPTVWLAIYYQ